MPVNSNPLLPHVELVTGAQPKGSVIWLHGLGADGWDFVPLVREMQLPDELPLRFIFPHAPEQPVTINNGYVMPAWYDIAMAELERKPDEAGIRSSQKQIEAFIANEISRGIDSKNIILAGFSQGGAITLQTGLRSKHELGGLVVLSSYLALAESLRAEATLANQRVPIFMAHGSQDPVVPLALAETSARTLKAHQYDVSLKTYPMPHSLCSEEVMELRDWLVARFKSPILLLG
jgi:phospholipase/carboxylesterase